MAKQSIGDKVAEKVVNGVNAVKEFANGGYKDTGKTVAETVTDTAKTVGSAVATGAKKACDFAVEKVFKREGETLDEAKARIKRGEFGAEPKAADEAADEIIIEGENEEVVVEEVKTETTDEQ